jgi:hypothetical protein
MHTFKELRDIGEAYSLNGIKYTSQVATGFTDWIIMDSHLVIPVTYIMTALC